MKLSEVIHYYIGAQAEFDGRLGKISAISMQQGKPLVRIQWREQYTRYVDAWATELKLYLRPLSSMTEEEAKDFIQVTFLVDKPMIENIRITRYGVEFWNGEIEEQRSISFTDLRAEEFHHLIKNNFDLFYLIESQQAIDTTKLNKNA